MQDSFLALRVVGPVCGFSASGGFEGGEILLAPPASAYSDCSIRVFSKLCYHADYWRIFSSGVCVMRYVVCELKTEAKQQHLARDPRQTKC